LRANIEKEEKERDGETYLFRQCMALDGPRSGEGSGTCSSSRKEEEVEVVTVAVSLRHTEKNQEFRAHRR
jgi:hypothetical protein